MKKTRFAFFAVAALALVACMQEVQEENPGTQIVGDNAISFTVKSGISTRSAEEAVPVVVGQKISLGEPVLGQNITLEETVTTMDGIYPELTVSDAPETRGTPTYTENLKEMAGARFMGLAYTVGNMTDARPAAAFISDGGFDALYDQWVRKFDSDPWGSNEQLLFYARVAKDNPNGSQPNPVGVMANSYQYSYNGSVQSMTFSYRSPLTAEDQQDILYAMRTIDKADANKGIPILFYHALSGVKFASGQNNNDDVKTYIKSVEFTGLYGYGKCTVKSTTEDGGYSDKGNIYSSPDAVSWNLSENGVNTLETVYSQEFPQSTVNYTSGSFANKGQYAESFGQGGNLNNLNDADASMTFWFPPQQLTASTKLTVTFEIVVGDGEPKEYTRVLDFGTLTSNVTWKAGELRTYTLKANEVDVKIEDEVDGFVKDNVVITNTGNVEAYIRAHIVANWWGKADNNDGIALGYKSNDDDTAPLEPIEYVTAWKFETATTDNYGGEFTGLPGSDWVKATDGYYYYTKVVAPGKPTGSSLFTKYELVTSDHPVPVIWYLSANNGLQKFAQVRLVMDIPVQAIQAPKDDTGASFVDYKTAWAGAGVTVVTE